MNDDRKPLAKVASRDEADPPMESLDVRITVRYAHSDAARLRRNARRRGEELSRYIRRCSLTGDSVLQQVPA